MVYNLPRWPFLKERRWPVQTTKTKLFSSRSQRRRRSRRPRQLKVVKARSKGVNLGVPSIFWWNDEAEHHGNYRVSFTYHIYIYYDNECLNLLKLYVSFRFFFKCGYVASMKGAPLIFFFRPPLHGGGRRSKAGTNHRDSRDSPGPRETVRSGKSIGGMHLGFSVQSWFVLDDIHHSESRWHNYNSHLGFSVAPHWCVLGGKHQLVKV